MSENKSLIDLKAITESRSYQRTSCKKLDKFKEGFDDSPDPMPDASPSPVKTFKVDGKKFSKVASVLQKQI